MDETEFKCIVIDGELLDLICTSEYNDEREHIGWGISVSQYDNFYCYCPKEKSIEETIELGLKIYKLFDQIKPKNNESSRDINN